MLVPLETLSGWPPAPDPSVLQVLGLLVGFPALVFIVIYAIAQIGSARQAARGTGVGVTDPVWVGGPDRPEIEGPQHDQAAADAEEIAVKPGSDVGGAGAHW